MVAPLGEIAQWALRGALGLPVIFLSGDHAACREIEALIPGVTTAAVKQGLSCTSAITPVERGRPRVDPVSVLPGAGETSCARYRRSFGTRSMSLRSATSTQTQQTLRRLTLARRTRRQSDRPHAQQRYPRHHLSVGSGMLCAIHELR